MAEHAVIDTYLAELRRTLVRHREVDDLVHEVADHLLSSVERWRRLGLDADVAERRTLEAFGDPALVARVYASERHGGLAMPTRFTHTAGTLLIAAGAAWMLSFGFIILSTIAQRTRPWEGLPMTLYGLGSLALLSGAIALSAGLLGLYRRHGGGGPLAIAGLSFLAVGAIVSFAAWAVGVWVPLLAVGAGLVAIWLRRRDLAPRTPALLLGVAPIAGAIVLVGLEATIGFDGTDTEQLIAQALLFGTLTAFVIGVLGLGRWLRSEQPFDDPEQALVA